MDVRAAVCTLFVLGTVHGGSAVSATFFGDDKGRVRSVCLLVPIYERVTEGLCCRGFRGAASQPSHI